MPSHGLHREKRGHTLTLKAEKLIFGKGEIPHNSLDFY